MSTFHERKKERSEWYHKYVKGWRLRTCTACNGSGFYDHNDSPKCESCNGSGVERVNPKCLTNIEPIKRTVLEYYPKSNQLLRIFIYNGQQLAYQSYGATKDVFRIYTSIDFEYDPKIKMMDWCFTDHTGKTHYLHQFKEAMSNEKRMV